MQYPTFPCILFLYLPIDKVTYYPWDSDSDSWDFNDETYLVLNRSLEDKSVQEWSLIDLGNVPNKDQLMLGTFEPNTYDSQIIDFQYKLTSKSGIVSSGSMELNYMPIPEKFALKQPYPNPFNPVTTIEYALPADTWLELAVYDIQGRLLTKLASGFTLAGYYKVVWDASQNASGLYFISMNVYNSSNTLQFNKFQKIMLVK